MANTKRSRSGVDDILQPVVDFVTGESSNMANIKRPRLDHSNVAQLPVHDVANAHENNGTQTDRPCSMGRSTNQLLLTDLDPADISALHQVPRKDWSVTAGTQLSTWNRAMVDSGQTSGYQPSARRSESGYDPTMYDLETLHAFLQHKVLPALADAYKYAGQYTALLDCYPAESS